jgi:transcriptional regulator
MYNLPNYKEKDKTIVLDFVRQHPFAFMAGCDKNLQPVATQIPVFLEERNGTLYLSGHMMRNTDHHKAFANHPTVLCVFTGPHAYVSATWYKNPHQASTWNYMSVHVKGTIRFLGDVELVEVLRKTSLYFEGDRSDSETVYDNLSDDYRSHLLPAIVAFEVAVSEIDHVFKLSQNRDEESYHNIINKLEGQEGEAKGVAEEMKKRSEALFSSPHNTNG